MNVVSSMDYSLIASLGVAERTSAVRRHHRLTFNIVNTERYFEWKSTLAMLAKFPVKFAQLPKILPFFLYKVSHHFHNYILHSELKTVGISMAPIT